MSLYRGRYLPMWPGAARAVGRPSVRRARAQARSSLDRRRGRRAGRGLHAESASAFESAKQHLDVRDSVYLAYVLVGTKPEDAREAQRIARVVAVRTVDHVERDLKHDRRLDDMEPPELLDRVLAEIRRHLGDLLVGESAVRLADRDEPVGAV